MSVWAIVLTASLAQNVILVHYLGVWPLPVVLQSPASGALSSPQRSLAALVWVSAVYWVIQRLVIEPLGVDVLGYARAYHVSSHALPLLERCGWVLRLRHFIGSKSCGPYRLIVVNTTVFVVSMGLARSVETYPQVLLGAVAAGAGLFFALVPLAAVRVHFERTRSPSSLLRGDVSVYLATAVMALAIQQTRRPVATVPGAAVLIHYPQTRSCTAVLNSECFMKT